MASGLTCATTSEITSANGHTVESKFHNYPSILQVPLKIVGSSRHPTDLPAFNRAMIRLFSRSLAASHL